MGPRLRDVPQRETFAIGLRVDQLAQLPQIVLEQTFDDACAMETYFFNHTSGRHEPFSSEGKMARLRKNNLREL